MFSTAQHSTLFTRSTGMGSLNAWQLLRFWLPRSIEREIIWLKDISQSFFFRLHSFICFLVRIFFSPLAIAFSFCLCSWLRVSENFADEKWVVCTEFSFPKSGRSLTHSFARSHLSFFLSFFLLYFSFSAYNLYSIWYFVISSVCFQTLVCMYWKQCCHCWLSMHSCIRKV